MVTSEMLDKILHKVKSVGQIGYNKLLDDMSFMYQRADVKAAIAELVEAGRLVTDRTGVVRLVKEEPPAVEAEDKERFWVLDAGSLMFRVNKLVADMVTQHLETATEKDRFKVLKFTDIHGGPCRVVIESVNSLYESTPEQRAAEDELVRHMKKEEKKNKPFDPDDE